MASHNYGLQYWIYTLVLHRYLANVLPGYRYETHFGGVFYLFVRGMSPAVPGSGVYAAQPAQETLARLDAAVGGGA
jgi:exodeoxyribonuclease V beta subunit